MFFFLCMLLLQSWVFIFNFLFGSNFNLSKKVARISIVQEGWDGEGGRETQEGGDMGIYVYV